jgi:hypothetical protein
MSDNETFLVDQVGEQRNQQESGTLADNETVHADVEMDAADHLAEHPVQESSMNVVYETSDDAAGSDASQQVTLFDAL